MADSSQEIDMTAKAADQTMAADSTSETAPVAEHSNPLPPAPAAPDERAPDGMSSHAFAAMGTTISVLALAEHGAEAEAAVRALFAEWEARLSRFLPESELSHLNAHAGKPVEVSPLLWNVLEMALRATRATDGRFDPTLLRQMRWIGYDRTFDEIRAGSKETPQPLARAMIGGDWRRITVDATHRRVTLPPGAGLDFGGIAKGMAVDAALDQLRALGLTPALVNAGGDLAVAGQPPGQPDWPIAVPGRDRHWAIPLRTGAMATSTVTRRNWRQGDVQRHHLIDPATGLPTSSDLISVTAVAPTCGQAEVGAKVTLILGAAAGARFLDESELAGLLIPAAGDDHDYYPAGSWPQHLMREMA